MSSDRSDAPGSPTLPDSDGAAPRPPGTPPLPNEEGLSIDIVIGDDGEVIFTDLPAELIDVALALDPDSDLACRRPVPTPPSESSADPDDLDAAP